MAVVEPGSSADSARRRHPRLVERTAWLQRHALGVTVTAAALIGLIFVVDAAVHPVTMAGFYLIPLTMLALTARARLVAAAGIVCGLLTVVVFLWQGTLTDSYLFNLLYGALAGLGLVIAAYLIRRLSTISEYAILRAQLAETGADILSGGTRDDLDDLLQYALERMGEQLEATGGAVLLLEDGAWRGHAGFGLGVPAGDISGAYESAPLAAEVLRGETSLARVFSASDAPTLAPLTAHLRLERVLIVPIHAIDRELGILVFNRPEISSDYARDQIAAAEYVAGYLGVAIDNVRLMTELNTRRRDLEMVRDASLDFAQSLDMSEVLEAIVTRLLSVLGMHACDIFEVDEDSRVLRIVVSYDDRQVGDDDWEGREFAPDHFAAVAAAVAEKRPVIVTSLDDPALNETERDLLSRHGYGTQVTVPLWIRERVLAVIQLYDTRSRRFTPEEIELTRTIGRFAALAVDKARLFERQRVTAQRSDRLARRLQRLQSFAVDLNRRLERAELQDVLDEVVAAALDLVHVRAAAVLSGSGEYVAAQSLAVAGGAGPLQLPAVEAELLQRCRAAMAVPPDEDFAGGGLSPVVAQSDGLLFTPLESDVPLQASTLVVADKDGGEFDEEDRLLLATLGAQLSASLHNTTAYQREHAIAETFQQALLMTPPAIPGIEVGVRYRAATEAARVGGDFYDLITLSPGRLMVIVGDVCGKSLGAAAQSAVVRYMLRAYAAEGSPGEALSRLNSALIAQSPDQPFVTLVVAYIDVARHMFEYAVAGHPRPVILAGRREFPMPGDGNVPVGIFRGAVYPTNRAILPDDTTIVMYTDGMTDARIHGKLFGEERLREAVSDNLQLSAQGLADALLETVKAFAGGVLADDCAVVTIRLP